MGKEKRYEYIKMMREKQHTEERLERKNEFDLKDLTPYNMGRTIQGKDIVYK